jgi:hypothetical protein
MAALMKINGVFFLDERYRLVESATAEIGFQDLKE